MRFCSTELKAHFVPNKEFIMIYDVYYVPIFLTQVCLERPIYPCRSLCQKVKAGCIGTMEEHGFPWPSMLDCDKFPLDNDMCITSQSERNKQKQMKQNKSNNEGSVNNSDMSSSSRGKSSDVDEQTNSKYSFILLQILRK